MTTYAEMNCKGSPLHAKKYTAEDPPTAAEINAIESTDHTGDAAVMHPDRYVEVRDRIKDIIISGGENVSSVEVEATLLRHPAVRCLSHPTGRLIGHRPENALDLERTIEVALETGVALEVNGLPARLDLSGEIGITRRGRADRAGLGVARGTIRVRREGLHAGLSDGLGLHFGREHELLRYRSVE